MQILTLYSTAKKKLKKPKYNIFSCGLKTVNKKMECTHAIVPTEEHML